MANRPIEIPGCGGKIGPKTARELKELRAGLKKCELMISLDQKAIASMKVEIERLTPNAAAHVYFAVEGIRDRTVEVGRREGSLAAFQNQRKKLRAQIRALEHPSAAALAKRQKDIAALATTARNRGALVRRIGAAAKQLGRLLNEYDERSAEMQALAQSVEYEGLLDENRFAALGVALPGDDAIEDAAIWLAVFFGKRAPAEPEKEEWAAESQPAPVEPPIMAALRKSYELEKAGTLVKNPTQSTPWLNDYRRTPRLIGVAV